MVFVLFARCWWLGKWICSTKYGSVSCVVDVVMKLLKRSCFASFLVDWRVELLKRICFVSFFLVGKVDLLEKHWLCKLFGGWEGGFVEKALVL